MASHQEEDSPSSSPPAEKLVSSASEDAPATESNASSRPGVSSLAEAMTFLRAYARAQVAIKAGVNPEFQLGKDDEEVMTSELLDPIQITFSKGPERVRQKAKASIVPLCFWRTSYETSITLSSNTSKDTHAKHRERKDLKLHPSNAFQAIATWSLRKDLNRERIERQLIWNKKEDPSSYIFTFNHLSHAMRRAGFHYEKSKRIGQRVFISQINNDGLVAATVSAKCKTIVVITKKAKDKSEEDVVEEEEYIFDVDIPVWIRDPQKPEARSDLTVEAFEKLGVDMWVSITELRESNLSNGPKSRLRASRDYICAKGHYYEWLSCGPIAKAFIMKVMPWDGKELHQQRSTTIIRSLDSTEPWVWNWDEKRWVLDPTLNALAEWRDLEAHEARKKAERKAVGLDDEDEEDRPRKRAKMIEVTLVRPYINFSNSQKGAKLEN